MRCKRIRCECDVKEMKKWIKRSSLKFHLQNMGKLLIKRKQRVSSKRNIYFSSFSSFIAHPYALEQNPISLFINLIDEIQICWRMNFLYFTTSTQESVSLVLVEWLL